MDLELPGGVITTHCVSKVIRPGSKVTHDPLQFVKIQSTELSKKAVEQIRLAEEVKITKDKIKEVEEEWQNNLLNWKSKRRQSRTSNCSLSSNGGDHHLGGGVGDHHHHHHHHHHLTLNDCDDPLNNRKIKTFSEILNEKAKSGYRIGYNLHKYIRNGSEEDDDEEEEEDEDEAHHRSMMMMEDDNTTNSSSSSRLSSSSDESSNKKESRTSIESTPTLDQPQQEIQSRPLTNALLPDCLVVENADGDDDNETNAATGDLDNGDDNDADDEAPTVVDSSVDKQSSSSQLTSCPSNQVTGVGNQPSNGWDEKRTESNKVNESHDGQMKAINERNNSHNVSTRYFQSNQQQKRPNINPNHQQLTSTTRDLSTTTTKTTTSATATTATRCIKPLNVAVKRSEICRINSYNSSPSSNNNHVNASNQGKKVILKYKIEKDLGRQSSLPILSSSSSLSTSNSNSTSTSTSSSSSSSSNCDREIVNNWPSSSSTEITKDAVRQDVEPVRLSFRDKLSNFENLAKGEDIILGSSVSSHQPNIINTNQPSPQKERNPNMTESLQSSRILGQPSSTSTSSLSSSSLNLHTDQIKSSTEIHGLDSELSSSLSSNFNSVLPDLSPKPKPALPPRPAIGERKSLPVDIKLHQNVCRTSSDTSATVASDKIHSNYFRFATKPYTNPRILKSNGSEPVVCLQGSLSSITSTLSPSSSVSSPFQEVSNSIGPNNMKSSNTNSNCRINETDETQGSFGNTLRNNNSFNAIEASITSNINSITTNTSTDTVTEVNGLTKASFKHLSLSPQTSNSSVNSCTSNRTGSPLTTSAQLLDSITTTNTILDPGRPLSSSSSSHQGSPQIIDIRTSSGARSSNGQGDGESKRSNYPNVLISPFKVHRPIINSVSSENLSNSRRSSSTSCSLGEKARSEAQLIKKSNENLKSHHDQRSMLSISGKKKCSNCGDELGRGCAAMVIETLSLYYHINCFRCSVCHIQLGNGTCGTDVRVRSNRLHCQNCYSNDEVGLTRV